MDDGAPQSGSRPSGPERRRAPISLRAHFLLIVGVAFLPLLLFAIVSSFLFAGEERETFQRGAMERTRALLTAVDTELERSVAALEVLATSQDLHRDALDSFRVEAERVLASRPEWLNIHLTPLSGVQVLNLLRPSDAPFHHVVDEQTFERVVATRGPVVGNLFREPFTGRFVFPVRVPVLRSGEVRYVLSALVDPQSIFALLTPQGLPERWVGVVLDANERIVARTIGADLVGEPASESLRTALAREDEGWFPGRTLEGWPVYTPFNRSAFSGWSIAIGVPTEVVDASLQRSLAALGVLGAALLAGGFALAWGLSGRSVRSLRRVAAMAEELGKGRSPAALRDAQAELPEIAEIAQLRDAFLRASELIRARSEERDRVEASLRRADAQLRESEQRKDQFIAMLGHELRNPLGVVRTAVQLLAELPPDDPAAAEPRAMIERQVAHMTKLLDDLLDVSRIAEGRIQVTRDLWDLVAIVRQTVGDHRELFDRGGLKLELDLPEQPLWVMGDRTRLAQAVGNVLQNAVKYTDPGGSVHVQVLEDEGGESAALRVRDTGVGMEPEILEHAFEAFSQADRTIDRSRGGLGLGLALVKGLVELHGGSVAAESDGVGLGSEISIRLPLEPPLVGAVPEAGAPPIDAAAGAPRRILVIEDNRMAARSLQLYLTRLGHTVELAHSGPDGLAQAERFRPDLVLCDIGLPGSDGYEVARALRQGAERPYLVAVSGYGQSADRRRSLEAGFDLHLTKPVDLDELRRILGVGPGVGEAPKP